MKIELPPVQLTEKDVDDILDYIMPFSGVAIRKYLSCDKEYSKQEIIVNKKDLYFTEY